MSVLVEGSHSVLLGCQAEIIQEDRELAWAEKYVVKNDALKWILGRYVSSNEHNLNGHYFDLEELRGTHETVVHGPLNMLHRPRHIVGTFVATDIVYPTGWSAEEAQVAHPMYQARTPFVEALSAFWKYLCHDEYLQIERAWSEGSLFYSMEAVPQSVTCMADDGCGKEFAYKGRTHESYCDHLNEHAAKKRLNKPHFVGGALVIPPAKPGWSHADITEFAALEQEYADQAEAMYAALEVAMPHLSPTQWEDMMAQIVGSLSTDATAPAASHRSCKGCGAHMALDAPKCQSCGAAWSADTLEDLHPLAAPVMSSFGDYELAYELARNFSADERKKLAKQGLALDDGSYPIVSVGDLRNAIKAIGRANPSDRAKVLAHIRKRAKALGRSDLVEKLGS